MAPNWADASQYPEPRRAKPAQWAWEFLRRNPAYRSEYYLFVGGKYGAQTSERDIARKYGIDRMADPGRADLWLSLVWNTSLVRFFGQYSKKADCPNPVSDEKLWLEFDLSWPIEANLKRAKRALELFQDWFKSRHPELTGKRKRQDLYRTYLQMLDAEEAGASKDEMAKALYPGLNARERVKKEIARAKKLRDGDYLYVLL